MASVPTAVSGTLQAAIFQPVNLLFIIAGIAFFTLIVGYRRKLINVYKDLARLSHWVKRWEQSGTPDSLPDVSSQQANALKSNFQRMADKMTSTLEVMQDLAQKDPLTGLPNRAYFETLVETRLKDASERRNQSCLIFLDIDGFKNVNDTLGHHIGDQLIKIAADRLRLTTRIDDDPLTIACDEAARTGDNAAVARLGGDEFTVFLPQVQSEAVAMKIASRILRVMAEPFELGAQATAVSASIGIAMAPRDGASYLELLRAADTAMYHAKRAGRNRVELYSSSLDEELRRLADAEQDLREALANDQFELVFQPQYDCRTLKIASAEALIRWQHPSRGLVMPADFIPLAERLNLINQIGEWVISEAIAKIALFQAEGAPLRISVNVSPNQLQQIDFVSFVKAELNRHSAPPKLLELEITESVAMQNVELVADRLSRISDIGVSVAIDDFGVGYSNLASLIRLPFSRLKLDRSLLHNLVQRAEARTLVQTIISMANSLGFHSVAEGVETQGQLDLLGVMGCDVVQGFLLSHPVDEITLRKMLHGDRTHETINYEFTRSALKNQAV
ncbi:MAG: putative bifunctional diguanylate cyclase/phosphodiesterase [Sphingorhabdus sp.]